MKEYTFNRNVTFATTSITTTCILFIGMPASQKSQEWVEERMKSLQESSFAEDFVGLVRDAPYENALSQNINLTLAKAYVIEKFAPYLAKKDENARVFLETLVCIYPNIKDIKIL